MLHSFIPRSLHLRAGLCAPRALARECAWSARVAPRLQGPHVRCVVPSGPEREAASGFRGGRGDGLRAGRWRSGLCHLLVRGTLTRTCVTLAALCLPPLGPTPIRCRRLKLVVRSALSSPLCIPQVDFGGGVLMSAGPEAGYRSHWSQTMHPLLPAGTRRASRCDGAD